MTFPFLRYLSLALSVLSFSNALADAPSFLQPQTDIPLNGGTSRFDYQSLDSQTGTLYLAHMGAGQIVIFNTSNNKISATLSGFPGVTGLLVIPELHRLYASVTRRHQIFVVNTQSLKIISRITAGNFPDSIAYVPELQQLYVSDEIGGEVTVIDVVKNKRIASITLGGQVGNTRYDPSSHLVYVNGQAKNELVAIDPQTRKITQRYPITEGKHPHGLWIDSASRLAFIACDADAKLVTFDLNQMKETGNFEVGKEPDVLAFDNALGYLYAACESGIVSIFKVKDQKVEKIADFPVGENAHSVEVNSATHLVYFPLRKIGKGPVLHIMKPSN